MQNWILKFTLTISLLSVLTVDYAQTSSYRLRTADSLFNKKMYTQSFEHYQAILKNNEYTPAMLLKMAYIQEGLNHTGQALYYLNLYYLASNDPEALRKMEDLAAKYSLQGYQTTDMNRLLHFYYEYYFQITLTMASLCVVLLVIAFVRSFRFNTRPVVSSAFMLATLVLLFVHLNYGKKISIGIVVNTSTYFMDGPSAAADVVEIVAAGHRLEVIGKKDVWLKVKWKGATAYVKENSIQPVTL